MQGAELAAQPALREINRTATSGGCPNITNALTQRGPHRTRNASNTNPQQHQKTTNASPPRRGSKSSDDAAQLPRDAAAAALPSSLNAGDTAVCQCTGHPSGDANRESEESAAEAPEFGAEAPRSNKSEDVRAVAP
jgi:hypothetical protein